MDWVTETVKHEIEKQKGRFLEALIAPLVASLKGISGSWKNRKWIYGWKFLVPLHPWNNIAITNYFNYEPRFDGVLSRNNLSRIKVGVYVINLDDKYSKGTHWVSLFIN